MKPLQYDDFDVLIEQSDGAFRARVANSPGGETAAQPFVLPVTPEKLELMVLRMRTAHGVRALATDTTPETRQFGSALFDALFHDDVLDRLRNSLTWTDARGHGLRIRLRFSNAHELWNIPWELLYDKERHRFLCQFDTTPVVRYVDMAQPVQPLVVDGPIRMLVMISSPSDCPPLDIEKEWQQLSKALDPLVATGSLTVEKLPMASLEELRHATMLGDFHVFHYIGHGGLDKQTGDGLLLLTGPDGRSQLATGPELFVMLANSPIRLAVLNSCQGAQISTVDPYAGTAASLVHQGVPAVIAMQFEISDYAAIAFSRTLYEAIAYGWPVDIAVGEARRAILATSKSEWATPVLYLRAPDGILVEIKKPDRTPTPAQPTGLAGSVADQVVALHWAAVPAGLTPVTRWEVRRDGIGVGEVTQPQANDQLTGPGSYKYTVVAVGADEQRSTESAAWIAVVPDVISAQIPQPPATPTGLSGSSTAGRVDLHWEMTHPGSPSVAHWEIVRDGVLISQATSPRASDIPAGPGSYTYAVVAVGADGQRSAESAAWTALVPAVTTAPSPPQVPAAPTGLSGISKAGRVDLHWDQPDLGSSAVAGWKIFRDGVPIAEATTSQASDVPPGPGSYRYTVWAVGEDGRPSAQSIDWTADLPPDGRPRWLILALAILATALAMAGLFLWAPWQSNDTDGTTTSPTTTPGPTTSTPAPSTAPVWTPVPGGFREPINDAGVVEHNGELWVVGGAAASGKQVDVRVFDPQTEQWRDGPDLPMGVSHAPLVSTGQKLYLLGGLTTGDIALETVFSLDPGDPDGTWIEETRLPEPRFAGAAAWDGHRLVFAGGAREVARQGRAAAADIWTLQSGTWEPIEELQEAREKLVAAAKDDGTIWFGGGADVGRGLMVVDNVDVLSGDTVSDDSAITPVQGAAAVWTPETGVCVFGGSTTLPNDNPSKVKLVDCLAGSEPDPNWPDLPEARYGTGAAVIGDTVYVVGGAADPVLALAGAVVPAR